MSKGTETFFSILSSYKGDFLNLINQANNDGLSPLMTAIETFNNYNPPYRNWYEKDKKSDEEYYKEAKENFSTYIDSLFSHVKVDFNFQTTKTKSALEKENLSQGESSSTTKKEKKNKKRNKRSKYYDDFGDEENKKTTVEEDEETRKEREFNEECDKYYKRYAKYNTLQFLVISEKKENHEIVFKIAKKLIENGFVDSVDLYGHNALFNAISGNNEQLINLLVENCKNFNLSNRKGLSLLHKAVSSQKSFACKKLLESKADVNFRDNKDLQSPLHVSIINSVKYDITRMLLENKADPNLKDNYGIFYCLLFFFLK